jgi:hypothetical protein
MKTSSILIFSTSSLSLCISCKKQSAESGLRSENIYQKRDEQIEIWKMYETENSLEAQRREKILEENLSKGKITGKLTSGGGLSVSYFLELENPVIRGLFKPQANILDHMFGEGWRANPAYEEAAYRFDRLCGFWIVPATVLRKNNFGTLGSFQFAHLNALENSPDEIYRDLFSLFDALIFNQDRSSGNSLKVKNSSFDPGRYWSVAVDHGLAFEVKKNAPHPPTIEGYFSQDQAKKINLVRPKLLSCLEKLDEETLKQSLGALLKQSLLDAIMRRKRTILGDLKRLN